MAERIFLNKDVLTAARERISYLFDEFPNVVVAYSGGKDSTVVFHLVMEEATKRGRLPQAVFWLDQEVEFADTVDMVKSVMYRDDVKPFWLQVPFKMENGASTQKGFWKYLWGVDDEDKWVRPKDPIAIHEADYLDKDTEFYDMFDKFIDHEYGDEPAILVGGMRAEESPTRALTLTYAPKYKDIAWAKRLKSKNKEALHFTFYPIYDWSYTDVWHYIAENDFPYCKIYDKKFSQGEAISSMRVSSLQHAQALTGLKNLQELERENYNKIAKRLEGVSAINQLQSTALNVPKELPYMFRDWAEYRDYLVEHLVDDPEAKEMYKRHCKKQDQKFTVKSLLDEASKRLITAVLKNDYYLVGVKAFEGSKVVKEFVYYNKGKITKVTERNIYLEELYGKSIYTDKAS